MPRGDTGPRVKRLQRRLKKLNFNPGKIDGDFGPATDAAVLAFQPSEGLLPDGIIGPHTAPTGSPMASAQANA